MDTERYCLSLEKLDPVKAVRAMQEAYLQLSVLRGTESFDNNPAMESLASCLSDAGHIGYVGNL